MPDRKSFLRRSTNKYNSKVTTSVKYKIKFTHINVKTIIDFSAFKSISHGFRKGIQLQQKLVY